MHIRPKVSQVFPFKGVLEDCEEIAGGTKRISASAGPCTSTDGCGFKPRISHFFPFKGLLEVYEYVAGKRGKTPAFALGSA